MSDWNNPWSRYPCVDCGVPATGNAGGDALCDGCGPKRNAVNKITAAIAALVNALPGKSNNSTAVSLHGCEAARFRAIVDAGATVDTYRNDQKTEEWDCAVIFVNGISVCAYSEHRPVVRAEADPHTVEAALAQAQEALS